MKRFKTSEVMKLNEKKIKDLSDSQLRSAVRTIADTANKRYRRMTEKGYYPSVVSRVVRSGGEFSVGRQKSREDLVKELMRARSFVRTKQSTVKGYVKQAKYNIERFAEHGIKTNLQNFGRIASLFDRLKEIDSSVNDKKLRYKVLEELNRYVEEDEKTDEQIIETMTRRVTELYEEEQKEDLSEFFHM